MVLKRAGGKRGSEYVPSIYSLPVKILDEKGLVFDPSDPSHKKIAQLARNLENHMEVVAKKYYTAEKSIQIERIDDSVESPELVGSNARVFRDRLADKNKKELEKLEDLVKSLL